MSADELRRAAETLRWLGGNVTAHSGGKDLWFEADADLRNAIRGTFVGNKESAPDDALWIALMTPSVGLALADWLDDAAEALDEGVDDNWPVLMSPVHLARLINGGAA